MSRLLILGVGQYGIVAKEVAVATGQFSNIEFLDDNSSLAIGKLKDIEKVDYEFAFVAIGNPELRRYWFEKIHTLATLVHPRATVMPSAIIGLGSIIDSGCSDLFQCGNWKRLHCYG